MKPPHARPDPRYYPPETPERDEPLAVAFLGMAAIVVLFFVVFFIVPVLV